MTCQHCGAALPPFALFCGECGRSVSASAVVPPVVERPIPPVTAPLPIAMPEPVSEPERGQESELVAAAVPEPEPAPRLAAADALPWPADSPSPIDSPASPAVATLKPCAMCGTMPEAEDLYCAECGRPLPGDTRVIDPAPAPVSMPVPVFEPAPAAPDVESTRIVPRGTGGARFVLQFSTGESYTVLGSGLAGRNPHPEPGEYVDHLVTILDPGRSVSKTHFEFGQQAGEFWVSDRHSGNGTVLREPGAEPRPCEPGRRYPIVRGTRIDIGEQFVVVS
ncbi:MAG: zinc ribbon domain-containing protein [Microbacteriaceae bacterium]|nr:zinc ribbon domain-containing protein [Microbacteriaceae bacterium]